MIEDSKVISLDEWVFRQADLRGEARLHEAGRCPQDPYRCYPCYEEELEREANEQRSKS